MAELIVPKQLVIRRLPDGRFHKQPGKWHFIREGCETTCVCGLSLNTLLFKHETQPVGSAAVRAKDLCAICWPFEARNGEAGEQE